MTLIPPTFYESLNNTTRFSDLSAARVGQRGAINCVVHLVQKNQQTIAVVLPTAYGKTFVMGVSCVELVLQGLASYGVQVVPQTNLRDQVTEASVSKMSRLFKIRSPRPISFIPIKEYPSEALIQNNEYWAMMTTQMLSYNIDDICNRIMLEMRDGKRPPIFYIDECHTGSEANEWGKCQPKLVQAGARVVLLTGTHYRHDNLNIPGFTVQEVNHREFTASVTRQHPHDKAKLIIERYLKTKCDKILVPDYEYTYARAWAEQAICNIEYEGLEVEVEVNGEVKKISEWPQSTVYAQLRHITRSQKTIDEGVDAALRHYDDFAKTNPDVGVIVFTGNDDTIESSAADNAHAHAVKKTFLDRRPTWGDDDVVIITQKSVSTCLQCERKPDGFNGPCAWGACGIPPPGRPFGVS